MNDKLLTRYKPVIGLEIHTELNTKTKMFCRCQAKYFGEEANTHTCPVCLGLPGALPYPNKTANEYCIVIALALQCKITDFSYFERKNYFYPDLPKGYQVSQYVKPFGINGYLDIEHNDNTKRIRIRRVHMEEDTAKLIHQSGTQDDDEYSLIDFNRSGVPLVEIVTEPDIQSGEEAKIFLTKLQRIIKYLEVSDADMEKGNMRLEPNISLLKTKDQIPAAKDQLPNYKVEVKNINSFRFVEKAINCEIERQEKILEEGKIPVQETRGWDEIKNRTVSQRTKEEAHDYRYFPEPDIPPLKIDKTEIEKLKKELPELPDEKILRFIRDFHLSFYDAQILTREKKLSEFYEQCVIEGMQHKINSKQIANKIINEKTDISAVLPAELIQNIFLSSQKVQIDDKELEKIINLVINKNPKAVQDYKKGKINVVMYIVGQVMRKINVKIDASLVRNKIQEKLK